MLSKFIVLVVLGLIVPPSFAQYTITKYSVNNGGSKMIGGTYSVTSSIAQPDASQPLINSNYTLNGGIWHQKDSIPLPDLIFTNGFES